LNDSLSKFLLTSILVCLLILVFRPNVQPQPFIPTPEVTIQDSNTTVIKLEGDKIAVIDTNRNSGLGGTMLIFELNKTTNSFEFIGQSSYKDYFRNPQKYGIDIN
jgi:hypothetical protein